MARLGKFLAVLLLVCGAALSLGATYAILRWMLVG